MAAPFEHRPPADRSLGQAEGLSAEDVRAALAATQGLPPARRRAAAAQIVHTTTAFELPDGTVEDGPIGELFTSAEVIRDPADDDIAPDDLLPDVVGEAYAYDAVARDIGRLFIDEQRPVDLSGEDDYR